MGIYRPRGGGRVIEHLPAYAGLILTVVAAVVGWLIRIELRLARSEDSHTNNTETARTLREVRDNQIRMQEQIRTLFEEVKRHGT